MKKLTPREIKLRRHLWMLGVFITILLLNKSILQKNNVGFDLYRSAQVDSATLEKELGKTLRELRSTLLAIYVKPSVAKEQQLGLLHKQIIDKLQRMGNFAYVAISPTIGENNAIFITVELVDASDRYRLMMVAPEPQQHIVVSAPLLQKWQAYVVAGERNAWHKSAEKNKLPCAGYYCKYPINNADLQKYNAYFSDHVPRHKTQLQLMLQYDQDPNKRVAALYLLAYDSSIENTVSALSGALKDSNRTVRAAAAEMLTAILTQQKVTRFPLGIAVNHLDSPDVADRNDALSLVVQLVKYPTYAGYIRQHAALHLVQLLKMHHPILHKKAYHVLHSLVQNAPSQYDYVGWERWAQQQ